MSSPERSDARTVASCSKAIILPNADRTNKEKAGNCIFDIPTLLAKIPDEYKPMVALGIGSLMLVGLALFHGAGLHMISIQQKRRERRLRSGRPSVAAGALLFGWSVFLMLALHLVEITIWGFVIIHTGFIKHVYDAIYYCANAYTTLGMGSLDIDKNWRNTSPHHCHLWLVYFRLDYQCAGGRRGIERSAPRTAGGRT
jgi:hypothetical protein